MFISLFIRQIVFILDKTIKAPRDRDMDAPLYLDPNIVEYPDTAIEALQKEAVHLYNNAYALVAHTIGFNRSDIRGQESFDSIVANKKWFSGDVDLDYLYKRKIKVLFDAIMEFATKAQKYVEDEEKQHRIYTFKVAARNITEATKNLKIIQANIKVYSKSKNIYLADKYNTMRKDLGMLLRSVEELKVMKDENAYLILKQLIASKDMPKEFDHKNMRDVENLITENKISVANGTSILNDSAFIAEIALHMLEAICVIFNKEEWKEFENQEEAVK